MSVAGGTNVSFFFASESIELNEDVCAVVVPVDDEEEDDDNDFDLLEIDGQPKASRYMPVLLLSTKFKNFELFFPIRILSFSSPEFSSCLLS
jgi:hypothetical protein